MRIRIRLRNKTKKMAAGIRPNMQLVWNGVNDGFRLGLGLGLGRGTILSVH